MAGNGGKRPGAGRKPGQQKRYKDGELAQKHKVKMDLLTDQFLNDPKTQFEAWKALLPYLKRKQPQALEHSGVDGTDIKHDVTVTIFHAS
jgi:hypothetical protein